MKKTIFILLLMFSCSDLPPSNYSPEIISVFASDSLIASDTSITVECIATDNDNDDLSYNWTADDGLFEGSGSKVTWYPPQLSGVFNIMCTVSDPFGGNDKSNVYIHVTKFDTLDVEFNDTYLYLNPRKFNKGFFYFSSDQEWRDFQISNGIDENEILTAPVDFSKFTLIAVFYSTSSGCQNFNEIIGEIKRYKDKLFVYPQHFYAGACYMEIDPYQIVSVRATHAKAKFIP